MAKPYEDKKFIIVIKNTKGGFNIRQEQKQNDITHKDRIRALFKSSFFFYINLLKKLKARVKTTQIHQRRTTEDDHVNTKLP